MTNQLLSICVPTFNRSQYLRSCLENIIPQARDYGLSICISDNASTDDTAQVVKEYQAVYPNIKYNRNRENLGSGRNYIVVLNMAESAYAWLLGDDDRILPGSLDRVFTILGKNSNYDLVVVNGGKRKANGIVGRVRELKQSRLYQDQNNLLQDLGWHMTWISCLIFGRKLRAEIRLKELFGLDFMFFAAILDHLAKDERLVYWESEPFIYGEGTDLPSWFSNVFEIFGKNWYEAVKALPNSYTPKAKMACIKAHGVKSKCLSLKWLVGYRLFGSFNYQIYRKYSFYFPYVTNIPIIFIFFIAILPVPGVLTSWLKRNAEPIKALVKRNW